MKKKKIIFFTIISITSIFFLIYLINTIVWGIAMQPKPRGMKLTPKLENINKQIIKKYNLTTQNTLNPHFSLLDNDILENDIKDCEKGNLDEKLIFRINIASIQNEKYHDLNTMKKEVDSLNFIIQKELPYKECIDSVYFRVLAQKKEDAIKETLDNVIYDTILKYPVKK